MPDMFGSSNFKVQNFIRIAQECALRMPLANNTTIESTMTKLI